MPLADLLLAAPPPPTPLSTTPVVVAALVGYLALIFGIQAAMKNHPPQKLNTLFKAHNFILSAGSLLLLILLLEEIVPIIWRNGIFNAMCAHESWTSRMEFYYMINYYFKYLEFLDTVFLAFKKKPLSFLHVFHHSATALLCYSQLVGKPSMSWTVIGLNLGVHVLMYYYYYATARGAKFWWKKYLTMMQIIQFIIDLFIGYFCSYTHLAAIYWADSMPYMGDCTGSKTTALFGCGLLTSYLGLFINFYRQTYKKGTKQPQANGIANGHTNGKLHQRTNADVCQRKPLRTGDISFLEDSFYGDIQAQVWTTSEQLRGHLLAVHVPG
ncbi:GNS1/SUR4 family-domain-containing protein [Mycena pura]|uniref:Elongation of fatty acids protein n=1 Tax=Mycena pura TaxID=153505 RepID=A0AAD6VB68_9AGAR|nr:GNS1/SUR4 family-domain-containing protein [Mycena pura]